MHTEKPPVQFEASEANPALPLVPLPPATPAPVSPLVYTSVSYSPPRITPPPRRSSQSGGSSENEGCRVCTVLILGVLFHVVFAAFIYGYVTASSEPLPRGVINQTTTRFLTFKAFMYIFGILAGFVWAYFMTCCCPSNIRCIFFLCVLGNATFMVYFIPIWIGSGVTRSSYAHACNSDWLQIVLTGHTYTEAAGRNTAEFSLVETGEHLWTWTSNDPFQNDFNLNGFNSTNPSLLPSLGNVTIDHSTNELTRAWCFNTTEPCATGYVWPFDGLSFEVQFNGTIARMRNQYNDWSFMNVPGVIMHRVDENGQLGERLMQTQAGSCLEMKVCVSHAMRRRDGVVDPDVLVAAYWLLHKQAVRATKCSKPSD